MSYGELSNTQETMVLPMLQMKNIRGKPYITVSAKGIANGLSNIPNDGADFGPDTTKGATAPGQYGSPYTQTSGIQEAINTETSSSGDKILIRNGLYIISQPVTVISDNSISLIGETKPVASISDVSEKGNGVIIQPSSSFPLTTNGNPSFMFSVYSPAVNAQSIQWDNILLYGNNMNIGAFSTNPPSGYNYPATVNFGYFGAMYFAYTGNDIFIQTDGGPSLIEDLQFDRSDGPMYISGDIVIIHLELFENTVEYSVQYVSGNVYIANIYAIVTSGNSVFQSINASSTLSIGFLYVTSNNIAVTSSYIFLQLDGQVSVDTILMIAAPGLAVASGGNSNGAIYVKLLSISLYADSTVDMFVGFTSEVPVVIDSLYIALNGYTFTMFSAPTDFTLIKHIYPAQAPSTPSVPSSGTAQGNTNPYAVEVYVYGGAVTEIQITRNGIAETVLSVSTAIQMTGQGYKLNPGDSITPYYTTAPSWNWLSD